MDEVKTLISFIQSVGLTGLLIVLAIPRLRKIIFGNGESGVAAMIENLRENHLHEIKEGIEDLQRAD